MLRSPTSPRAAGLLASIAASLFAACAEQPPASPAPATSAPAVLRQMEQNLSAAVSLVLVDGYAGA